MKVAVIGRGKTGGQLPELIATQNLLGPYGRNLPTAYELTAADIAIVFVPADAIVPIIELLLQANINAIIGTTGYVVPVELAQKLKSQKLTWVWSSNFSLGVHLLKKLVVKLASYEKLLPDAQLKLTDIHHTHKKDAPSGTAKLIASWIPHTIEIESKREGDEVGTHVLSLKNAEEEIELTHRAFHRRVFAKGALWAARQVHQMKQSSGLPDGLISFEQLIATKGDIL